MRTHALSLRHLRALNKRHKFGVAESGPNSITSVLEQCIAGVPTFTAVCFRRKGAAVYHPATGVDKLLECVVNESVSAGQPKQSNRHEIVTNLVHLLREPCKFRVYKFDIKNFYESLDRTRIVNVLKRSPAIPCTSVRILEGIFAFCQNSGIDGMPRGMAVSASLAEQYLAKFDVTIRRLPEVFFYARFVDDILIMTSRSEATGALKQFVERALKVLGLELHPAKEVVSEFEVQNEVFDYLGYRFEMLSRASSSRVIAVDIAEKKVRRFKTRVVRSLLAYNRGNDFDLLRDRLKFLTGNHVVKRRSKEEALRAGIYHSYPHVTDCDSEKGALRRLDRFLRRALTSNRLDHSRVARSRLSRSQRSELIKMSFRSGHKNRLVVDCDAKRLNEISRIWKHV